MCYNRFSGDSMQVGDSINLTIENLDHQGRGIGHYLDKTIFVSNALPGEVVKVIVDKLKKNIAEAHVEEFKCVSEERIISSCPYFNQCGGCDLLHLTYDRQLLFKENKIREIMHRFCNYDFKINNIIRSDLQYNYRNKVTFQINNNIGFYERGSNRIVPVSDCKIISDKTNQVLKLLNSCSFKRHLKSFIVRSNVMNEILLDIKIDDKIDPSYINKYFLDIADSIIINDKVTYGSGQIIEQLGNYKFLISPKSFFQVNTKQTLKLYNLIKKYADLTGKEVLLDLYCGTGTIGIYLSSKCKEVVGIEINESAVKDANRNKDINEIDNVRFICGDALKQIAKTKIKPNIVIVDPPRAGLNKNDIKNIINLKAEKIIYVSCDPITLARDLNILSETYKIKELTPVDMFPNTSHVECVCVLNRR